VAVFHKVGEKTEVLLGLRVNNPGKGKWSFPGGGAEGKENLTATGIREFREETGIQLYRRFITRIGIYKINNCLFEWETQLIETIQNIDLKRTVSRCRSEKEAQIYNSEFSTLEWINIEDVGGLSLHRWVKEVITVYQSDAMKIYTPESPSKKDKGQSKLKASPSYKHLRDDFGL
jgi:8-oxo-dGTP pyrophosphatase MutT (NUDIX family)